jgi:hypothetical protein
MPLETLKYRGKMPLETLKSWSYSTYTQWMACPLSIFFDKIKRIRIVEPLSPVLEKGKRVHDAAEHYIGDKGRAPKLIDELKSVKDRLATFRRAGALVEQEWAFTKEWMVTRWNDWTGAWLRMKIDVLAVDKGPSPLIQITDWKTGRIHDEHRHQRSLYALGALQLVESGVLAKGDKTAKLAVEHLYTDTTQSALERYTMKDLKPLKAEWLQRTKQMMSATKFPPHVGRHCQWCRFRKSAGGPCPEKQ